VSRLVPGVAAALLVVLAGCGGAPPATDGSPAPTGTVTDDRAVVAYGALRPPAQQVVEDLLANGSVTGLTGVDSVAMRPLLENEYVRYENRLYGIDGSRERRPRYTLVAVERVERSTVDEQRRIVAYETLAPRGQEMFTVVRAGRQSEVAYDPGEFQYPADYVRYRGEYYRLSVTEATQFAYEFTIERPTRTSTPTTDRN
jgi:hypothetical protein